MVTTASTRTEFNQLRRFKWVSEYTGLPKTTLYRLISKDRFPKPVKLGERAVAWREGDVIAWVEARAQDSQQGG